MIETRRLILREYTEQDFSAIHEILSDPETMRHYPKPFDEERTRRWIQWNLQNYRDYGFGLWAVVLRETGKLIGDCGLTLQDIDGEKLPEIGYHIHKKYWRRGFGSEAARAVRDWAFRNTAYDCLYSYMKYTNAASYSTAMANGMKKVKEYPDEKNGISCAYAITRAEWEALTADMITLSPMTRELCHQLFRDWQNDPATFPDMSQFTEYRYDPAWVDRRFDARQDSSRVLMAILKDGKPIGELQLKQIDPEKKECTIGIHMQNDSVKGRGYGTRAEQLAVKYAFEVLGLDAVNADAIIKNTRSQHVLEKSGFRFVKEENGFRYYRCERSK